MILPSKLFITPVDQSDNFGFHYFANIFLSHCLKLGFKPVESINNPSIKKFVNLTFNFDESSIHQYISMLSPFENDSNGNMLVRSPFIWYTDLKHCSKADTECETFMIQLGDEGRCKHTLYQMALGFIDRFTVIYVDAEAPNKPITLTRSQIEAYLNPVKVLSVA